MVDAGRAFVKEFVLGFGFISGLWIYIGINPETEILKTFAEIAHQLDPNSGFIFWLIPFLMLIASTIGTFALGGKIGVVAVFLAFMGGVFIGSFGIWILIPAILLGLLAPSHK